MSQIFDATGDGGHQNFVRLIQEYEAPEYVKDASVKETTAPEGLHLSNYADTALRQFPCHTKSACYVSSLFFLDNLEQLSPTKRELVRNRLVKFAEQWGILDDVLKAGKRHGELEQLGKEASLPDSAFAIVFTGGDGSKERRYPLRNGEEVQKAASWFATYRDHFIFDDRQKIAQRILDKAAEFGASFPEDLDYLLEKQAGRGVYNPADAVAMLRGRSYFPGVPETTRNMLQKLASQLSEQPLLAEDPTTSHQIARTVDQFDRVHNLVIKYAEGLIRPEDVLFKGTLKQAGEFISNACATPTGAIYEKGQFAKLSVASVREAFGDALVREVTTGILVDPEKMADVAATLPLPDAVALDQIMKAAGQAPVRTKAAALAVSESSRRALAAEYELSQLGPATSGIAPTGVRGSHVVSAR